MRKHGPLLARFAEASDLPRFCLIFDLQYKFEMCLYERILPWQTRTSAMKRLVRK